MAVLNRRTEGWPVALYLAALAITADPERSADWPGGKDRYMVEYLQSEVLSLHQRREPDLIPCSSAGQPTGTRPTTQWTWRSTRR